MIFIGLHPLLLFCDKENLTEKQGVFKKEIVTEKYDFNTKYPELAQGFSLMNQDFQQFMIKQMLHRDVHEMTQDDAGQKVPLLAHTIHQAEGTMTKSLTSLFFKVIEDAIEKNTDLHDINDPLFTYVLQNEYFEPELKSCVNTYKNKKEQLLFLAALEKNNTQMIQFLLEIGVDVNQVDELGNAPLHIFAEKNMFDSTQLLLTVPGIDVNKKNAMHNSPLDVAVAYPFDKGSKDIALLLLDFPGLRIDQNDKIKLVYSAVCNNHELVVKKILDLVVDLNDRGLQCDSSLHKAVDLNLVSIVKMLLAAGADMNMLNCHNKTALGLATEKVKPGFGAKAEKEAKEAIKKLFAQQATRRQGEFAA